MKKQERRKKRIERKIRTLENKWKRENLKNIYVEETGGEIILEKY